MTDASDRSLVIEATFLRVDGETCDRCGDTRSSVLEAVESLKEALQPLHIPVTFVEHEASTENLDESNTLLLNGRLLEEWLGATRVSTDCPSCSELVGESVCCSALSVDGEVHEAITTQHVMTAALAALGFVPPSSVCC